MAVDKIQHTSRLKNQRFLLPYDERDLEVTTLSLRIGKKLNSLKTQLLSWIYKRGEDTEPLPPRLERRQTDEVTGSWSTDSQAETTGRPSARAGKLSRK